VKNLRLALLSLALAAPALAADDIPGVWKAKCASCHGEDGKAQTKKGKAEKIADMTTEGWQTEWTDEKMKKIIIEGSKDNKNMKPFKGKLTDEQVDGLIKHIRGFKG
jgi:cytochrome c553